MKIFAANWKRNLKTEEEATKLIESYIQKGILGEDKEKEIIVFTPCEFLNPLWRKISDKRISLGMQDTNENIVGIENVLIGHSDVRREYESFFEGHPHIIDEKFREKISNSFKRCLRVIYCVGETELEKSRGETFQTLDRQLVLGLSVSNKKDLTERLIIAYEPRWAIGGDKIIPTLEEIKEIHQYIRWKVRDLNRMSSLEFPVLYGGSVNQRNIRDIMGTNGVNGVLVGNASLDAESFSRIVNYNR